MTAQINTNIQAQTARNRIHPLKLALWIGIVSLIMMFTALTSAYIVRRSAGNWLEFSIPTVFYISTVVIMLSSLSLHASYRAFKRGSAFVYRYGLLFTLVLGIIFLILQYVGWNNLAAQGVPLKINPSGDFIYAISGLHAVHVLGGLGAVLVAVGIAFYQKVKPTPARKLRLELTLTYWHFVDILWIYLIIFLSLQR